MLQQGGFLFFRYPTFAQWFCDDKNYVKEALLAGRIFDFDNDSRATLTVARFLFSTSNLSSYTFPFFFFVAKLYSAGSVYERDEL